MRTPHFTLISNTKSKRTQEIGSELERMRAVFVAAFPNARTEGTPIVVLALKDETSFEALLPAELLGKGKLQLAGLFLRGPEKNYILLRADARGQNPYAVIYHEYTHYLLRNVATFLPLWLNEGLAEFYGNTQIRSKDVLLGKPSDSSLMMLRNNRMLPLETLLRVDHDSPYYREEDKGSMFYAESWALTHYLQIKDQREQTQRVLEYIRLTAQKMDSVEAATKAFGDLKELQSELQNYFRLALFGVLQMKGATEVDENAFKLETVSTAQADAYRADFLAYARRTEDAQALAQQVLQEEPENVLAYETLGFMAYAQRNFEEAGKWYGKAVALKTQSFLAHYYYGASFLRTGQTGEQPEAESSLRTAIRLNPTFAPSYDALASYYGMRRSNLDEARQLSLRAIELDSGKVSFRLNHARILMQTARFSDAVRVIQAARQVAESPQEQASAQNLLVEAEEYAAARERADQLNRRADKEPGAAPNEQMFSAPENPAENVQSDIMRVQPSKPLGPAGADLTGTRTIADGKVSQVMCAPPARLDLTVSTGGRLLVLHTENYFRVDFTAANFTPGGELQPCTDLEGVTAKIEYVASGEEPGQIVSVEIHR